MEFDEDRSSPRPTLGRRSFLHTAIAVAATASLPLAVPGSAAWAAPAVRVGRRTLCLHNINTGERFDGAYWADGAYVRDALKRLNVLLRDHRGNAVGRMDPRLLDVLWQVQQRLDSCEPYEIICGFRSRRTNAAKRAASRGVAKDSYHTKGMAVDVRLPGRDLGGIAEQAMAMRTGGVSVYRRSGFVHLDTGPVRTW